MKIYLFIPQIYILDFGKKFVKFHEKIVNRIYLFKPTFFFFWKF